jgi:hypothetical protein
MRLLLLALPALFFSTGCAAMVNSSGTKLRDLKTKTDVHKVFGQPKASGEIAGEQYEDFHTHRKIAPPFGNEGLVMIWVLTLGFSDVIFLPPQLIDASCEMIRGQNLRFCYAKDGTVMSIYIDGKRDTLSGHPDDQGERTPEPSEPITPPMTNSNTGPHQASPP